MQDKPHPFDAPCGRRRVSEIKDKRLQAEAHRQLLHPGRRSPGQHGRSAAADRFPRDQFARVAIGAIDHPRLRHGAFFNVALRHTSTAATPARGLVAHGAIVSEYHGGDA